MHSQNLALFFSKYRTFGTRVHPLAVQQSGDEIRKVHREFAHSRVGGRLG
jgi:hypothetical protein